MKHHRDAFGGQNAARSSWPGFQQDWSGCSDRSPARRSPAGRARTSPGSQWCSSAHHGGSRNQATGLRTDGISARVARPCFSVRLGLASTLTSGSRPGYSGYGEFTCRRAQIKAGRQAGESQGDVRGPVPVGWEMVGVRGEAHGAAAGSGKRCSGRFDQRCWTEQWDRGGAWPGCIKALRG